MVGYVRQGLHHDCSQYALPRCETIPATCRAGSTQQHWPFPPALLHQGYAYILSHPGTPCIFYDHLWQDGSRRTSVWGSLRRLLSSASSGHRQVCYCPSTGHVR